MRKQAFYICENKNPDQLRGNREADQRLCFRYMIVQSLYFLNPNIQASSRLVWSCSPVCVGPGRQPRRSVFSQRGSFFFRDLQSNKLTSLPSGGDFENLKVTGDLNLQSNRIVTLKTGVFKNLEITGSL